MIGKRFNCIEGRNINDVWRDAMLFCVMNGWDYLIKGGSYVGQIRKQIQPLVTLILNEPWSRPFAPVISPPLSQLTTDEQIETYFMTKIIDDIRDENHQYTYGEFIKHQLPRTMELLIETKGNTNQACIGISDRDSVFLDDPPCLRMISFKIVHGRLNMTVFFRSWDLISGLPENLGALQMLKEYVLVHICDHFPVEDGLLIAHSDGLHIYQQYFEYADMLNVKKIEVDPRVLKAQRLFLEEHPELR